jgi:DNA-binding transcriptional MerR regulator
MFENYSTVPILNVKAMVHQTGIAAATLRAWERRYGIPTPPRTDSGYRLYSARDVAVVRWLKTKIDAGMNISHAVHLLQTQNKALESTVAVVSNRSDLPASYNRLHDDIIASVLKYDEDSIEQTLGEAFSLIPVEDVCMSVIEPVLYTIGEMWHSGKIDISTEHFTTAIMRRKLMALLSASPVAIYDQKIVSACAPGEFHELGILMISLFLRRRGYAVVYLGQNLAQKRLEDMIDATQPDMMLLSASTILTAANMLSLYRWLRNKMPHAERPILAFGGRVFNNIPLLKEKMPAVYVGDRANNATQRIVSLLNNSELAFKESQKPTSRQQIISDTLRARRADIVAEAARRIISSPILLNGTAPKHERGVQVSERLYEVLDSAVIFDEPAVLAESAYWEWDSETEDGLSDAQLRASVNHFAEAVRRVMPQNYTNALEPFLSDLHRAFA